eukprot:7375915-Prymnesium_polylepis.1
MLGTWTTGSGARENMPKAEAILTAVHGTCKATNPCIDNPSALNGARSPKLLTTSAVRASWTTIFSRSSSGMIRSMLHSKEKQAERAQHTVFTSRHFVSKLHTDSVAQRILLYACYFHRFGRGG